MTVACPFDVGAPASPGSAGTGGLIVVRLNGRRVWRWHVWLVRALTILPGCRIKVAFVDGRPVPVAVELLLRLERLTFRLPGEQAADLVPCRAVEAPRASDGEAASLVIDLAGDMIGPAAGGPVLRALYCGHPDELNLISALLARSEVRLGFAGCPDEHLPSIDSPDVLTRALNTAFCALLRLCLQRAGGTGLPRATMAPAPPPSVGALPVAAFALHTLGGKVSDRLGQLCRGAPRWRVGWRTTDEAGSVHRTRQLPAVGYRVLPDDGLRYYADPFLLRHDGRRTLFVEEYPRATGKGLISAAPVDDDGTIGVPRPVLELDGHASYPFVFHHAGAVWMIPETSSAARVDLYRAERVPDRWEHVATLLDGVDASDVTLTRHDGLWWMFAATQEWQSSSRDTLCLFSARDLRGPWVPHPANPVLVDKRSARPGGALFRLEGVLWRSAQDATKGYGSALSLCRVDALGPDTFAQTTATILRPGRPSNTGLHTLNFDGSLEVIDGLTLADDVEGFLAVA